MIEHPLDGGLLQAWGSWVRAENDSGLGYAQVQYAELIARATSATGWSGDFDPRISELDHIIRTQLAHTPRRMLELRYVYRLTDKRAAAILKMSRQEFNRGLHMLVLPQLRHAWDCHDKIDRTQLS